MKKILSAILIFVYFLSSFGVTVNEHYCMGKFVSWNIGLQNHDDKDKCLNCGMTSKDNKKGCCHDEEKQLKLKDDQQNQKLSIKVPVNFVALLETEFTEQTPRTQNLYVSNYVKYRPPIQSEIPIFIRNCTFLI